MVLRTFLALLLAAAAVPAARAADPPAPRPYDGIQAGWDAFRLAEERRQAEFAQQLATSSLLAYGNAWPWYPAADIYGDPLAIWGLPPAIVAAPVPTPAFGWGFSGDPGHSGYRAAFPARQPVGRVEVQTGSSRWESHPIYDPPLAGYLPSPPVASPLLKGTPYEMPPADAAVNSPAPAPRAPPAVDPTVPPPPPAAAPPPAARRGPREY